MDESKGSIPSLFACSPEESTESLCSALRSSQSGEDVERLMLNMGDVGRSSEDSQKVDKHLHLIDSKERFTHFFDQDVDG